MPRPHCDVADIPITAGGLGHKFHRIIADIIIISNNNGSNSSII